MSEDKTPAQLKSIKKYANWLDSNFTIPGTKIKFGYDFIIGLIPFGGELITFLFSSGLMLSMAQHGASSNVIARMCVNVILDTLIGAIPIVGDIFDLFFKANKRNYRLLEKHYQEGKYQGSAWKIIIVVSIVLLLFLTLAIWAVVSLVKYLADIL